MFGWEIHYMYVRSSLGDVVFGVRAKLGPGWGLTR